MLKKILEIKADAWEKALSLEVEDFVGGIFKVFSLVNPFIRKGNAQPTPAVVQLGAGTINTAKVIRSIVPVYVSSVSQFYELADDSRVYLVDPAAATVSDVSAQVTAVTGTAYFIDRWKGGVVYSVEGHVEYNAIPLSSGSKVQVIAGTLVGTTQPFCVGADGYGYIGNNNNVAKLTSASGTSGNSTSVAASLESGFVVRQLINDGRYLVWLADDSQGGGKNRCIAAYWDLAKSVFDQIYEWQDSKINSAELIGDTIKVITSSGIYWTNIGTRPRLMVPFGGTIAGTHVPSSHNASCVHQGSLMLWGTGAGSNDKVYALGNKYVGKPDRLFQPHTVTSSAVINAIASDNTNIVIATVVSGSAVSYSLTTGLTNNTAVANVAAFSMPQAYSFDHITVIPKNPIASGDSITTKVLNSGSTKTVKASETKTNSTDPGEKNLVFDNLAAGSGDVGLFDELSDIEITYNVPIRSVEVWGEPTDEGSSHG